MADGQGPPSPACDLYLQNSFSRLLDPSAVVGPLILRGWGACPGLLGCPSDSSADPGGDSPQMLPLFSLQEKATHFHPEASVLSLRDKQVDNPGKQLKRFRVRDLEM